MIPCESLFLEIEVPDPSLNYFIINQNEMDNTEKLMAPAYGQGEIGTSGYEYEQFITLLDDVNWYVGVSFPLNEDDPYTYERSVLLINKQDDEYMNCNPTIKLLSDPTQDVFLPFDTPSTHIVDFKMPQDKIYEDDTITVDNLQPTVFPPYYYDTLTHDFAWNPYCASGQNTFVLNQSCFESEIDLLEGWGAAKPNYIWSDVISQTTNIEIDRGFDVKQSVVGTPIAGVLRAEVVDPNLDGLGTSIVGVGGRVRVRAGTEVVFIGVANVIASEYNAVDTPTLYIEATDALGLMNGVLMDPRPQETYTNRVKTAVESVQLPAVIPTDTQTLNPTEDDKTALEVLIQAQDSEGSICWIDRFGTFYSTSRFWTDDVLHNSRFGDEERFVFTNGTSDINVSQEQICLSDFLQTADTRQVINAVTFYNYTAEEEEGLDENGEIINEIVNVRDEFTFRSPTSSRLYGDASLRLQTYLDPSTLSGYANHIFSNWDTPRVKVEKIAFPLDKWENLDVPEATTIDIGDKVRVHLKNPKATSQTLIDNTQRVARIRHIISPSEWLCELDLL